MSKHLPQLLAQARAMTRDEVDAQDLVQDTCVRALAHLERTKTAPRSPAAWLRVVMRNVWFNTLRARRTQAAAKLALGVERADLALVGTRITRAQLRRLWERVPRRARRLVVECLVEGEARGVVAGRTGLTKGAIDASIYRTRAVFREEGLGGQGSWRP